MLSGSQVQLEIQYSIQYLGRPNHNCTINAVTGEGLPEGVEWLTAIQIEIQYSIQYLGRPNHNCTINAVTGEGLPEGVEWLTGTATDTVQHTVRSCAAKALFSCPAISSQRLESRIISNEPPENTEEESKII